MNGYDVAILSIALNVFLLILCANNHSKEIKTENIRRDLHWLKEAAIQSANLLDKDANYVADIKKLDDEDIADVIILISSILNKANNKAIIKEMIKKHG